MLSITILTADNWLSFPPFPVTNPPICLTLNSLGPSRLYSSMQNICEITISIILCLIVIKHMPLQHIKINRYCKVNYFKGVYNFTSGLISIIAEFNTKDYKYALKLTP